MLVTNGWLTILYIAVKSGVRTDKKCEQSGMHCRSYAVMDFHEFHEFHHVDVPLTFYENIKREKPCIWT